MSCLNWLEYTDIVYPKDTTDLVIILQCNGGINKTIESVRKVRFQMLLKGMFLILTDLQQCTWLRPTFGKSVNIRAILRYTGKFSIYFGSS